MKRDRPLGPFSRDRIEPSVLAKIKAPRSIEAQGVRAMQVAIGKLETDKNRLLTALREALDGWSARASDDDVGRIDSLRKRWNLQVDETDPEDEGPH